MGVGYGRSINQYILSPYCVPSSVLDHRGTTDTFHSPSGEIEPTNYMQLKQKLGLVAEKWDRIFEIRALTEVAEPVVIGPDISHSDTISYAAATNNHQIIVAFNNKGWGPFSCLLTLGSKMMEQPLC